MHTQARAELIIRNIINSEISSYSGHGFESIPLIYYYSGYITCSLGRSGSPVRSVVLQLTYLHGNNMQRGLVKCER